MTDPVQHYPPDPTHLFVLTLRRPPPLDNSPAVLLHSSLNIRATQSYLALNFFCHDLQALDTLCTMFENKAEHEKAPSTRLTTRLKNGAYLNFEVAPLKGGDYT